MDTRSKILTLDAALSLDPPRPIAIAIGRFEVLRAAEVRDLSEARARTAAASLLALVLPDDALMAQRARVEMVAALRVIDYVVAANHAEIDRIAAALQPIAVVRLEDAERERVRQLIAHVHRRQVR